MKRVSLGVKEQRGVREEEDEEEEKSVNRLKSHRQFEMHHCRTAWS
jgi:hypothetical protein